MTDLDIFLTNIMPYAPGCPEPTAFKQIVLAAQEFCTRTRLWRECDTFNVTPSSCNFVCVPSGAVLFELESAHFNGSPLEPISIGDLNKRHPRWRTFEAGIGQWITQTELDSVMIVPRCTGKVELSTFLKPADDADQLPDFLSTHYRQCIAEGALANILMLPGQPFTAPDRAQYYSLLFNSKVDKASTTTAVQGQQRAPSRVRAQFM